MDTLIESLRALPEPTLMRDLTADILLRVEAIERPPSTVSTVPEPSMWAIVFGPALAAAAITISVTSGDLPLFHVLPLSVGGLGVPTSGAAALSLLVGLALYVWSLFGTVGQRRMPYSSTST